MATSKTEICNVALSMFGGQRIIDLNDPDTEEAKLCAAVYDTLRLDLLDQYSWNCATKRAALNQLSATPVFGYDYKYELPSDYIRILEVEHQKSYPYVVEGNQLHSNNDGVNIRYIYDIEDVSRFSQRFSMTLSAYIAATICYNLTESRPMTELITKIYADRLFKAKSIDGQEGVKNYTEESTWITDRDD